MNIWYASKVLKRVYIGYTANICEPLRPRARSMGRKRLLSRPHRLLHEACTHHGDCGTELYVKELTIGGPWRSWMCFQESKWSIVTVGTVFRYRRSKSVFEWLAASFPNTNRHRLIRHLLIRQQFPQRTVLDSSQEV